MSTALTKKQQKALAFRAKQKAKKHGKEEVVPADIPEQDPVDDDGEDVAAEEDVTIAETSKKRKRGDDAEVEAEVEETKADGKGKGKAKAKTAWDEEGDEQQPGKKTKKEIKQRFILFVGNLGYKVTKQDVQRHFTEAAGAPPAVRLLTTKPTKPNEQPKSRGIAFVEVPTSTAMQACLKLHHTAIQGRQINVELTAGGGGKSDSRSAKIKERNERVGGQRTRRAEREKEEEAKNGGPAASAGERRGRPGAVEDQSQKIGETVKPTGGNGASYDGPEVTADGVKIRGGRRVKAKPKSDGARPRGGQRPDGQARRPRWEPTGANAVRVG